VKWDLKKNWTVSEIKKNSVNSKEEDMNTRKSSGAGRLKVRAGLLRYQLIVSNRGESGNRIRRGSRRKQGY